MAWTTESGTCRTNPIAVSSPIRGSPLHDLRFALRGLPFERQAALPVEYKETLVGEYLADFIVDNQVVIELKAVAQFHPAHEAQAHHYLAATGLRLAILLNFGAESLQYKRIVH